MPNPSSQERYGRQLIIPEISADGQARIRKASVFIAGIGGLGSISGYYMAAAGTGRIRLVDADRVEVSNLNRQIMHRTSDIGRWKARSAEEKLLDLNPECRIEALRETVTGDNILGLTAGFDLILDATDNLAARQALNQAALALRIPFIYGGISGFTGMVSTFRPGDTACFQCIFAEGSYPPEGPIGALGPVAGVVAALQCVEALEFILHRKSSLMNRMLRFDGRDMSFKKTRFTRNEGCAVCSQEGNRHGPRNQSDPQRL